MRRVAYVSVMGVLAVALAGCAMSFFGYERRASWRDAEEKSCMSQRLVVLSAWDQPKPQLDGGGACGIYAPIKVSAFESGSVPLAPAALMNCPMTTAVDTWLAEAVQPAALAWFGEPIVAVTDFGAYSCRPVDDIQGNQLSEHSFGNAIDISGFRLMDGTLITVKRDWFMGGDAARGFLREIFAAGCERFKTALGPGAKYHSDHFHLDLAHHGQDGVSRYCNPRPDGPVPARAPYSGMVAANQQPPQPYDWRSTSSVRSAPGPLLTDAPPDVIAQEIEDASAGAN